MSCCVKHCSTGNKPSKRHPHPVKRQLFPFPVDKTLKQQWVEAIGRKSWSPKPNTKLCEAHFSPLDLLSDSMCTSHGDEVQLSQKKKLAPLAIPCISLHKDEDYMAAKRKELTTNDDLSSPPVLIKRGSTWTQGDEKVSVPKRRRLEQEDGGFCDLLPTPICKRPRSKDYDENIAGLFVEPIDKRPRIYSNSMRKYCKCNIPLDLSVPPVRCDTNHTAMDFNCLEVGTSRCETEPFTLQPTNERNKSDSSAFVLPFAMELDQYYCTSGCSSENESKESFSGKENSVLENPLNTGLPELSDEVLTLPSNSWIELTIPGPEGPVYETVFAEYDFEDATKVPTFLKTVLVNYLDSTATKYMLGKLCSLENSGKKNPVPFGSVFDLNAILKDFHEEKRCDFIRNEKYKDVSNVPTGTYTDGIWRANDCHFLASKGKKLCVSCQRLKAVLDMRLRRRQNSNGIKKKTSVYNMTREQLEAAYKMQAIKLKNAEEMARTSDAKADAIKTRSRRLANADGQRRKQNS